MGRYRVPGPHRGGRGSHGVRPGAGFRVPNQAAQPLRRIVTHVTKDWDPPHPRTTPEILIQGRTLEEAAQALNRLPEWGEGGGRLRVDRIPSGRSAEVTAHIHANLLKRLPRWAGYARASQAAKDAWDGMLAKLEEHEQRHVDIAIEAAERLAQDLVGREVADVAQLVTDANAEMQRRQVEMDADTDHGARENVPYGDVVLDTSVP
jgi:uncharacterized protein DUF922